MTRLKRRRNNRIIKLLILLIILLLLIPGIRSLSKYIYNSVQDYYFGTKNFYFNSDKLTTTGSEFEIANNWSGAETYRITVNLNSKKNDLVFAESDIDYTISCTSSSNITYSLSKTSGTIVGSNNSGSNEDYFIVTINPANGTGLANGTQAWVDLEVTSTSPYVETLSGKLYVGVGTEDISYEIIDAVDNPYLEVKITNSLATNKPVTLTFDPTVIRLDMTSRFELNATNEVTQNINNYAYVNSVTSVVNSLETETVKFYKLDASQNYAYQPGDTGTPVVTMTYNSN